MTDRKKLEEALVEAQSFEKSGWAAGWFVIMEAAEAHLASLPKPMWKVRAWKDDGAIFGSRSWLTAEEAMSDAMSWLACSCRKVEIEAP